MKGNILDFSEKLEIINGYKKTINIMEVCGTHTVAIGKSGLRGLLNPNINLLSGPGCPVCVTTDAYIDYIYDLALKEEIIIATYGDMIRVPGSSPSISLEKSRAKGAKIKMVYSSMDAVKIAQENRDKKVVFLGIGFETTTPATAVAVLEAEALGLSNFFILSMHKRVEPVMKALIEDKELLIDGFLCPGHVAAVIGEIGFKFLEEYNCLGVIAGFEGEEVIDGIHAIIESKKMQDTKLKNVYSRLVEPKGNEIAVRLIGKVFQEADDSWRGLGIITNSGLKLNSKYEAYDIEKIIPVKGLYEDKKTNGCQCGEVLRGKIKPTECALFGSVCNPENPVGPCMVSGEGGCAAYYRYTY